MKIRTLLFFVFLICQQSFSGSKDNSVKAPTTTVSIAYNSPFCTYDGIQNVFITGTGNYNGGTYSSMPAGLLINPITGAISPSASTPGWYTVNYTIAANGTDPTIMTSAVVNINAPLALIMPSPLSLCDDGPQTIIETTVFDLTVKNNEITQNLPGHTVTYYPSYADALAGTNAIADPTAYTNVTNAQTIGVKVTTPHGCSSYTTLDIRVLPLPTPNSSPATLVMCDNFNNGTGSFDLTLNETYIGNGGPYTFEYYTTQADAVNQINAIATPTSFVMGTGFIWIRVMNNEVSYSGSQCYVLIGQSVIVNPLVQPVLTSNTGGNTICVEWGTDVLLSGLTLDSGISDPNYTFQWYLNGTLIAGATGPAFYVGAPGNYGVTAISPSSCSSSSNDFVVVQSGPPTALIPAYTIENVMGNQNITVHVVGYGIYHYQLDAGPILDNGGLFEDVSIGSHSISVYDVEGGCGSTTIPDIDINQTPPPTGNPNQTFSQGQTLANLIVSGSGIQWYASASGGIPLPSTTVLASGVTYYASQIINGHESSARLGIFVQNSLGNTAFVLENFNYYPNPVTDYLNIKSKEKIKTVTFYNTLGQEVYKQNFNDFNFKIELSSLVFGTYFVKIESDNKQNIFKIIKL